MNKKIVKNSNIVEDSKVITITINDFYINIDTNLAGKIKPSIPYIKPTRYIQNNVTDFVAGAFSFHLQQMQKYLKYLII